MSMIISPLLFLIDWCDEYPGQEFLYGEISPETVRNIPCDRSRLTYFYDANRSVSIKFDNILIIVDLLLR